MRVPETPLLSPSGAIVPDVRQIVVLRASAVGDYIVALPALQALRRAYPAARVTLLGRRWHTEFLRDRPGPVDEAVELPDVAGITVPPDAAVDFERVERFIASWQARRADLAVQLHGGGRFSNPFVRRLGARVSIGLCSPDAVPLDRNLPYIDDHHPVTLQLLECVALAGAAASSLEARLSMRPCDEAEAFALVPPSDRPLVVLQPGASHVHKRWHPERFAAVGDAFAARGAQVAVNGSADEAPLTRQVCRSMRTPAIDLAGKLSVGALAALLSRARLLLSNDTGPAHLARAVGTPTVTIFWVGNARSFGPLSTRWHRIATSWRMNCPQCNANAMTEGCDHAVSLVDDVPVEAVLDLAEGLFTREAAPSCTTLHDDDRASLQPAAQ
jgi:ADP-heptose:LPS heptosyltransferase